MKEWKCVNIGSIPEAAIAHVQLYESEGWTFHSSVVIEGVHLGWFYRITQ